MPIIILSVPFIHHSAGSVFNVSDTIGYSRWDEDDRMRDRQSFYDKRTYVLPDDGKGKPTELLVADTILCPQQLLENIDLHSGPCRVTSVSKDLEQTHNDPWYAHPFPMGRGKLLLKESPNYLKNIIIIDETLKSTITRATILDCISKEFINISDNFTPYFQLDFSDFDPGFYKVALFNDSNLLHSFTIIKCFPIVVTIDKNTKKHTITPTLW